MKLVEKKRDVCVLDTNALLIPFEFGLDPYNGVRDLIPGVELVTLEECVDELKRIKPRSWVSVMTLGLQRGLKVIPSGFVGPVDDIIVEYAVNNNCFVLTQDIALRKRLLASGLRVVLMRRKKTFELVG